MLLFRALRRRSAGLPAKLRSGALGQFDAVLSKLQAPALIGLGLVPQVDQDDHIATRLILSALRSIRGIRVAYVKPESLAKGRTAGKQTMVALGLGGASFVLSSGEQGEWVATQHDEHGGQLYETRGTWVQLRERLQLCDECIGVWIRPSTPQSFAAQFVTTPFWALRREALTVLGAAIVITLLGVVTPLGFQAFTDKILPFNASSSLVVLAVVLTLAMFSTSVIECAHDYLQSVMLARYQNSLGREMLARLLRMPIEYFDAHPAGDLTKLTSQVREVAQFLVKQSLASVVAVLSLLIVLPLLLLYSVPLTAMVLGVGAVMAMTVAIPLGAFQRRITRAYGLDAGFQSGVIEMIKGLRTIKSLSLERHFEQRLGTRLENQLFGSFEVERLGHVLRAVVSFQSRIVTVLVLVVGAQAVFKGQMSVGQLIAFNMLADRLINPLVALVFTVNGWQGYRLAKAKLSELVPAQESAELADEPWCLDGDIEFDDVWFRYPGAEHFALKGVSMRISRGSMVGIVGQSGSGKSTLFGLLMGFYQPTRGRIRINGFDLRDVPKDQLRGQLSVVSQTNFLFSQSVFENVRLGRPNARFEEVIQAIAASDSAGFVDALPGRYACVLTEDGVNLSGGQRQRLAIARAFLRQSPIMLFDEATSALDHEAEQKIRAAVRAISQGKTCLLIAHHVQTLADCDQVLALENGSILAHGSPTQVCEASETFSSLWRQVTQPHAKDANAVRV